MKFTHLTAAASAALILVSISGCALTSIHTNAMTRLMALGLIIAMLCPVPAYWHMERNYRFRDAALVLPWAALVALLLPFPLLVAARLRLPLRDALLARIDAELGINVPRIVAWSHGHWAGHVINHCYLLLLPMLLAAIFLPALTGRLETAQRFLIANLVAFAIAVPLFALFPALGPWSYFHFAASSTQIDCQAQLSALRESGAYFFDSQGAGIVSFPSFHMLWAVLCAAALWEFRKFRPLTLLVSVMIAASTITTGWHYFIDVLAGAAVAAISLYLSKLLLCEEDERPAARSATALHRTDVKVSSS